MISFDDVSASAEKYGRDNVLEIDYKKIRDLRALNPKSKFDTSYIPLVFKHINGKTGPVKIKFSEQMIGSGAKVPQGSDDEGIAKNLNISITKLIKETVEGGDYVPKKKDNEKDQEKENKRMADNIKKYLSNNEKFLNVLNIIDASYKKKCDELKVKESSLNFQLKKDRKQKDIPIYSMKQVSRMNKDTNKEEELENPIYRLKVPVYKKDGRIGIWSNYHNVFKPTVFDARKMTKKNNYQPVPAKVMVNGKLCDLDVNNANSFIVYKSLIGGTILFDCIVSSKFGLSLSNSFYDLYVFKHKTKATQQTITKEEILAMRGGDEEEEDEDSDAEVEDIEELKTDDDDEEEEDDGGDGNDEPYDEDDIDELKESDEGEEENEGEEEATEAVKIEENEAPKKSRGRKKKE